MTGTPEQEYNYWVKTKPLPFRPDVPVYRVVLSFANDILKISKHSFTPEAVKGTYLLDWKDDRDDHTLTWYLYPISASERKSKRQ